MGPYLPNPPRKSYLYHWNRLDALGSAYNHDPVCVYSRTKRNITTKKTEGNYLSKDFKLKCIICYSGTGSSGHYYVVREHLGNWFEISGQEVKLAVECKRKDAAAIITELNNKYETKILMAFYDYDPDYRIGI